MGALSVRLPESLHNRIRRLAEREGISLNQFVMLATAEKATLLESEGIGLDYLAARAHRAEQQDDDPQRVFRDYVAGTPDVDPEPADRLEGE